MPASFNTFLIYKSCILYLVIPILLFFLGWLKLGIGLILSSLLIVASIFFLQKVRNRVNNINKIFLSKEYYVTFIILFLFLLSTGNTGFVGCWGTDIPWRNAIYQDLIRQPWPLTYSYSHSMLCYYMTFWLVPALISSLLHLSEFGSNVVLFIWMYIGLVLIFFLLCDVLKPKREQVILIITLFLFFSGINTFGMILKSIVLKPSPLIGSYPGGESWSFSDYNISNVDVILNIRSIYLCIADVYNQFFAIILSTLLYLRFRGRFDFYALIVLLVLPYSPIGFIGFFVVVLFDVLVGVLKYRGKKELLRCCLRSLSLTNIFAIISIVPIFYFYFGMNSYASEFISSMSSGTNGYLSIPIDKINGEYIIILLLYYYFYFIIYSQLIYDNYKRQSLFWITIFCLMLFPFFKIGSSADFNFNASICPYFILFLFIGKHLLDVMKEKKFEIKELILVFFLSIAMLTPITQIATSLHGAYINNSISYKWTPWDRNLTGDSFRDKDIHLLRNFLTQDYENKMFYIFFAKN